MRKIITVLLCIVFLLSGCKADISPTGTIPPVVPDAEPETAPAPTEGTISEPVSTALLAVSVPADSEHFYLEDGTELFTYTAQHMQLILPDEDIADRIILDFLNRVDAAKMDSESILIAAQQDYEPDIEWFPYFYQLIYSPTRIDHGVLSLFGVRNSFAGSMHGNLSCVAANYDLSTGNVLTLGSIMHPDAQKDDFIAIINEKLRDQSEEYNLFEGFEDDVRNRISGDENLYEDFFFTGTGLSFFFAPYEIAPYASGIITVEIPYSELPGLIFDGYFPAERERIEGKMITGDFMSTDMEQFNNMAEITLATGEEIMVVYPEGRVEDIRITIPGNGKNLPPYTAFAALEMSAQNAVVISLAKDDIDGITVTYMTDGNTVTIPLAE